MWVILACTALLGVSVLLCCWLSVLFLLQEQTSEQSQKLHTFARMSLACRVIFHLVLIPFVDLRLRYHICRDGTFMCFLSLVGLFHGLAIFRSTSYFVKIGLSRKISFERRN